MSTRISSEQTAATVEAAIRLALEELGALEDDVIIEVLSTPRSGVLGLGARPARVRVTRRPPEAATSGAQSPPPAPPPMRSQPAPRRPLQRREEPQSPASDERPPERQSRPQREERPPRDERRDERPVRDDRMRPREEHPAPRPARPPRSAESGESGETAEGESAGPDTRRSEDRAEQTREATAILGKILELMGEKGEITEGEKDPDSIELEIKGDGSGLLIGRHGQTLDALEYIVNRVLARRVKEAVTIVIDTESYRARRRQQIHRMALSMGEQAKREHATVRLEPMAPRERRIVHLALKDDPLITTRSEGEGYLRSIEISPVGGGAPREGRSRERGRERERSREPERGHEPAIGEQGGFKHGQKRII